MNYILAIKNYKSFRNGCRLQLTLASNIIYRLVDNHPSPTYSVILIWFSTRKTTTHGTEIDIGDKPRQIRCFLGHIFSQAQWNSEAYSISTISRLNKNTVKQDISETYRVLWFNLMLYKVINVNDDNEIGWKQLKYMYIWNFIYY